ncbi:MAG TPA: phosphodiester glycosidase family protein, partial [Candidatus Obscuribacterales bacterium]
APTSSALVRENALAAINAGFFNLSDGESASYVFIDGKKMCEPRENHDLVSNPRLKPFLEQIFNRTEVRFVEDSSGRRSVLFARHNQRLPNRVKLIHSIQAGPRLLPTFTAADEAFIRTEADGKDVDSIGCKRTAARTAFGVTADNRALLLTVAGKGQDEFSSGITLDQLIAVLRRLGCVSAINFDGGTSTTMAVRRTGPDVEALMLDATGDLPEVTELKAKLRRLLASHNADAVDVMKLQVAIAAAETKRYRHSVHDTSALSGCDFAHEPHEQRELEEALRRRFEQSAPAERQHAGAAIVVCGRSPETRVKSILMIVPKK